jgi:ATP-dependent DNA helicase RecG
MAGTQQSGVLDLKIANLITDQKILGAARHAALEILEKDPLLNEPQHGMMLEYLQKNSAGRTNWSLIS